MRRIEADVAWVLRLTGCDLGDLEYGKIYFVQKPRHRWRVVVEYERGAIKINVYTLTPNQGRALDLDLGIERSLL